MGDSQRAERSDLLGESELMCLVRRSIQKLGSSRCPVLILGETGTGKELVAQAIHRVCTRGPFVVIDCGAMVGTLMESQLFGHTKGSYTGAVTNEMGLLEYANGGTAFFDEIGELQLDVQSRLLRALQQQEFRPLGSLHPRKSDFRILAATNRDLRGESAAGRFRQDLYFRLAVAPINLPPLRERREDIPLLVRAIMSRSRTHHILTEECIQAMMSYDWPGNVRELENCISQLVALNTGPQLHRGNLPDHIRQPARGLESNRTAGDPTGTPSRAAHGWLDQHSHDGDILTLDQMEKRSILAAIGHTKGDRAKAARLLGIGRTTLYRKLCEYNLSSGPDSSAKSACVGK